MVCNRMTLLVQIRTSPLGTEARDNLHGELTWVGILVHDKIEVAETMTLRISSKTSRSRLIGNSNVRIIIDLDTISNK